VKTKRVLIAWLAFIVGLLVAAALVGLPASQAAGPPPTGTPQMVKLSHPFSSDLVAMPAGQPMKIVHVRRTLPGVPSFSMSPATVKLDGASGWQKIMAQDFEGTFPPPGWQVFDDSSTDGGEYLWGKRDCKALSGSYSMWAGGGGSSGERLACTDTYTSNLKTWLAYGPVDLSQVTDAELQFSLWGDILGQGTNPVDLLFWGASTDDVTYYGLNRAGQTHGWIPSSLDLTKIGDPNHPGSFFNFTGQPKVYVAWLFISTDTNRTAYNGAFVDDAALWVYSPPSPTPPLPTPTLPVTRHTTLADFAGGRSYDGSIVDIQQGDGALALAAQASVLGGWERLPGLPTKLAQFAAVIAQDHLFIVGGNSPVVSGDPSTGYQRRVYSSPIADDGRLGHWQETTSLPQALIAHGAVVANGHVFVVGGFNDYGVQDTVFSAPINPDGSLGTWSELSALPQPLARPGVVAAHGYLYVLGGQRLDLSVSDKVYRAAIHANGTIGDWLLLPDPLPVRYPPQPMAGLKSFVALVLNNFLYILGGDDNVIGWNYVFRASIGSNGDLGAWEIISYLPQLLHAHAGVATRGGILIAGGLDLDDFAQKAVYWAAAQPDGSLGPWIAQPGLFYETYNSQLVASDTHVYNLGGRITDPEMFSSILAAPLLTTTQVLTGSFNHQFELGQSYLIRQLRWQEAGNLGQVQIRYRVASSGGIYGLWSAFTLTQPVSVNAVGTALEYEFLYQHQGSAPNDKVINQVEIELSPVQPVYLPIVLKNR
jgi:hypothetical protein